MSSVNWATPSSTGIMCQTWSSNEVLRSSTPSMFVSGLPRSSDSVMEQLKTTIPRSMIIRCFHVSRVLNRGAKNTQLCAQYTVASRYRLHGSESIPVQQCNCRLWHYLKICTIFESKLIETSCESQYKRSHSDLFLACPNSALENHSSTANTSAVPGCPSFVGKKPA